MYMNLYITHGKLSRIRATQTLSETCIHLHSFYAFLFWLSNGVRQGGILSPHLFNFYIDDLGFMLNKCNTGCVFNGLTVNHLMYADDIVIFSPSVSGLQKLLATCETFIPCIISLFMCWFVWFFFAMDNLWTTYTADVSCV